MNAKDDPADSADPMDPTTEGEKIKVPPKSIFFTCGHVIFRDTVIIPAQYNAMPDADISRVAFKFGDSWVYHDVDKDMIGSVTFLQANQSLWLLGRHGLIQSLDSDGKPFRLENLRGRKVREDRIATGRFGELLCIKAIAGSLYVCGQSSQVYKRTEKGWEHMDAGIFKMAAPTLESIDGTAPDDLYAVGEKGTILHYDGKQWHKLDSPTNRPLSTVRCVNSETVYICGNDGLLFRGNEHGWEYIGNPDVNCIFWDLEAFGGTVYLAHHRGMMIFDGTKLQEVDFGLKKKIRCHKVHANDGVLWSFGVDDLLYYDGANWTEVICPHNT